MILNSTDIMGNDTEMSTIKTETIENMISETWTVINDLTSYISAQWTTDLDIAVSTNVNINSTSCDECGDDVEKKVSLQAEFVMQIIYLVIGTLGIVGNFLVAFVILHFRSLRKNITNVFIVNQSLLDLTASFFIITTSFIRDMSNVTNPVAQEIFCRVWLTNLPVWGIFVSSTYNLVAMTFERYSAIVSPLQHNHRFTRRKAYIIIAIIWVIGPAFNAAYMIPSSGMIQGECTVFTLWSPVAQTVTGIITVILQYFIPITLIIYAYTRIALVLKQAGKSKSESGSAANNSQSAASDNRQTRISRARKNVIKTLAIVSVGFIFCWTWNQIFYTMFNLGYPADFNSTFYHFTVIMVFCNSCINPIVYCFKYQQFQKALKLLFCKRCLSTDELDDLSVSKTDPGSKHLSSTRNKTAVQKTDSNYSLSMSTISSSLTPQSSGNSDKSVTSGIIAKDILSATKL